MKLLSLALIVLLSVLSVTLPKCQARRRIAKSIFRNIPMAYNKLPGYPGPVPMAPPTTPIRPPYLAEKLPLDVRPGVPVIYPSAKIPAVPMGKLPSVPFTDMRKLGSITKPVLGQQKLIEMPYQNVVQPRVNVASIPTQRPALPELSCPCSSPFPLVNPFLPAASPVSAMSPPTSSLLPAVMPGQSRSQYLRKIPIPPPSL